MRGGQSAIRHPLRSIGLVSTVGSLSGTPPLGTEKRSCNASPKLAARGSLCPSPWVFVLWEASDQSTWPTPHGSSQIRRVLTALISPCALGAADLARLVDGDRACHGGYASPALGSATDDSDGADRRNAPARHPAGLLQRVRTGLGDLRVLLGGGAGHPDRANDFPIHEKRDPTFDWTGAWECQQAHIRPPLA